MDIVMIEGERCRITITFSGSEGISFWTEEAILDVLLLLGWLMDEEKSVLDLVLLRQGKEELTWTYTGYSLSKRETGPGA